MAAVLHAVHRRNSFTIDLDGEEESGKERKKQIRQEGRDQEQAAREERKRKKREREKNRKQRKAELDEQFSADDEDGEDEEADADAGAGGPPREDRPPAKRKDEAEDARATDEQERLAELLPKVMDLEFSAKISTRRLGDIKSKDLVELYAVLGAGRFLRLSTVLRVLTSGEALRTPLSEAEASDLLREARTKAGDPKISPEKLHKMLSSAKAQDDGYQSEQDELAKTEEKHGIHLEVRKTEVSRDDMLSVLIAARDRHDDFALLPWTSFYIIILVIAVNLHLRIYDRQLMESALEDWVNGRDPYTQASTNVDDLRSYWEWALDVGLPGVLGDPRDSAFGTQFYLASRHVLLGDISITAEKFDNSRAQAWLLNSPEGKKVLGAGGGADPAAYLSAARRAGAALRDLQGWNSSEIENIWMTFITYNEFAKGYTITTAMAKLNEFGTAVPVINADAFNIDQYLNAGAVWAITVDLILLMLNIRMAVGEARELASRTRCWDEFKGYWNVWNIIDWCSVVASCFACIVWVVCVVFMRADTFRGHLDKEYRIAADVMAFEPAHVQLIHAHMFRLRRWIQVLHVLMAICTVFVVLKFFKGFQSNPRLKVVTDTFQQAATDLAHFFIIFLTLFLPFTIIGHILFGNDIPQMGSVTSSMNTGVELLMGEFGWYSDVALAHIASTLPSGMPTIVLFVWFFVFNFMMVLVVLNMLLAVVLEHYTKITGELDSEPDKPPIWKQAHRLWRFQRKTRGFISIAELARQMEDPENPAHKEMAVSPDSLKAAFPSMSDQQAKFLMEFLQRHTLYQLMRERNREQNTNHQPAILQKVKDTGRELQELGDKVGEPHPDLMVKVEQLLRLAKNVREDQKRLTQHVERISSRLPEERGLVGRHGPPCHRVVQAVHLRVTFGCTKKRDSCSFCHLEHDESRIERVALAKSTLKCFRRRANKLSRQAAGARAPRLARTPRGRARSPR